MRGADRSFLNMPMPAARPKRALLAWEQGLGFGHTVQLERIGTRLRAHGVEVAAVVRDIALAAPLAQAGIRLVQGPPWAPPAPRPGDEVPASATLTDNLAQFGLRDPASVRPALAAWTAILDREQPDLLVCDYAPLAACAGRGRMAIMQAGTAFCLPPADLDAMPLLHGFRPPRHTDAEVMAAVNAALDREGLPLLRRIGDLFHGDDAFVRTFPLIDPYADLRRVEAEGPLLVEEVQPMRDDAEGIFAYLHPEVVTRPDVRAALCLLGPRLQIYTPRAPGAVLAQLRAAGARVHPRPVSMSRTLAGVRLILHQGSAGVAADALAAGIPQFAMAMHVEHFLNGEALAAAGVGRSLNLFTPSVRVEAGHILGALEDAELAGMAAAAGHMHRAALASRPLDRLTERCLALL